MAEKRKPEDTACPIFSLVNVIFLAIRAMAGKAHEEVPDWKASCLGKGCHMFMPNDKKCGLRHR